MQRPAIIAGSLALAAIAGVVTGIDPSLFRGTATAETVSSAAPGSQTAATTPALSLAAVMRARSPGERGLIHFLSKVKTSSPGFGPPRGVRPGTPGGAPPAVVPPLPPVASVDDGSGMPGEVLLPDDPIATAGLDFGEIIDGPAPTAPIIPVVPTVPIVPIVPIVGGFTSVYSPVAGAVPEPSTWAMMLVGFGVIAAAQRRRERRRHRGHPPMAI